MPVLLAAPLLAAALATQAATPSADELAMAWFGASELRVDGNVAGEAQHYRYRFQLATNHDLRIEADYEHAGKPAHGTMLLVDGWLAVKDLPLTPEEEIDAIDGAVITYQMTARLLSLGASVKPDAVTKAIDVKVNEAAKGFSVSTASADMTISAPWSLQGRISPAADRSIDFDLDLSADQGQHRLHYSGKWLRMQPMASLPGSFPLTGWRIFHLGPVKRVREKSVEFDYGAEELKGGVASIDALRHQAVPTQPRP